MTSTILVPVSTGELFDKISILEIKSERIIDQDKLTNVHYEMRLLKDIAKRVPLDDPELVQTLLGTLKNVNTLIWDAGEKIHDCERRGVFDDGFLEVSRSIHRLNDARASVKRELNVLTSSPIIEEKSYTGG